MAEKNWFIEALEKDGQDYCYLSKEDIGKWFIMKGGKLAFCLRSPSGNAALISRDDLGCLTMWASENRLLFRSKGPNIDGKPMYDIYGSPTRIMPIEYAYDPYAQQLKEAEAQYATTEGARKLKEHFNKRRLK